MRRIKSILAVLAMVLVMTASAAPAMADGWWGSNCYWGWSWWWGWFWVCEPSDNWWGNSWDNNGWGDNSWHNNGWGDRLGHE